VDRLLQLLVVLHHVLGGESLVGEAHVHDGRGMAFGGGQVDQAAGCPTHRAVCDVWVRTVDELSGIEPGRSSTERECVGHPAAFSTHWQYPPDAVCLQRIALLR